MIFSGEPCCHPRHWARADEMEPGVHRDTGLTQLCWARGINGRVGRGRGDGVEMGKGRWGGGRAVTALHTEDSSLLPPSSSLPLRLWIPRAANHWEV